MAAPCNCGKSAGCIYLLAVVIGIVFSGGFSSGLNSVILVRMTGRPTIQS